MEDGSISDVTGEFFIEDDSSVDLGDLEYIRGIRVEGPGLFTLLLFSGSCETLFDDDFQNEEDRYHGFHTGTVKNFEAAITYNFAPVLARCLYFNSTKNLKDHIVKVAMVTSKFLLAEYMTVHAEWNKAECGDLEVMSRRDIIPDSAIDIHQIAHDVVDFANGSVYPVPAVSYGVVDIHLDDIKETWIESLSIWASVAVAVKIDISTERGCTDQIRGYAHNMSIIGEINTEVPANTLTAERFTLLKRSGFTTFCGENITTIISAVDPTAVAIFTFTLQLYGCVLDAGKASTSVTPSFTSLLPVNRNTTSTPTVSPSIETDGSGDYHATDATTIAPTPVDNSVTTTTKRPDDNLTTTTTQQADVNSVTTTTQQPNYNSATSVTQSQDTTTTQGHVSPTTQGQVNPNTQGQVNPNTQGQVSPITQGQVTPTTQGQVNPNTQGQANPITQGQVSPTTQGQVNPNTQGQVSPTTQGQVNPTTQNQNSESVTQTTRQVGNLHTTIVPSQSCTCTNLTRNITQEELDIIVKELIRNLTVPATETSAYKRTKMSMPDERRSSAVIGAVGITSMVTVTGVVIAMDAAHILNAYNFIKSLLSRN
ncbi:mucin-5AC-like [Mercenaria mercenaria]|uniref:mucin-5AC-like n=1 Tax=Mercenaria mercenaria TaxID=6596 RepID=UPI00234F6B0B|nr:mucin-5AC-like [Mercenaria mercenaria]